MACKNVHVIHFKKKSTPFSAKKKKVLHPQLKKKNNTRVKTRTPLGIKWDAPKTFEPITAYRDVSIYHLETQQLWIWQPCRLPSPTAVALLGDSVKLDLYYTRAKLLKIPNSLLKNLRVVTCQFILPWIE